MITRVYFRCDQDTSDFEGMNSRNWFGEDSYYLGEMVGGQAISHIGYGFTENTETPCIVIGVGSRFKLYCEIPMTSVTRVYHSLEV